MLAKSVRYLLCVFYKKFGFFLSVFAQKMSFVSPKKDSLEQKLIESGERDKLTQLLRKRLHESGWYDQVKYENFYNFPAECLGRLSEIPYANYIIG